MTHVLQGVAVGDVAGSLGSGRPSGPDADDALSLRVDKLFAGALEEQLSEQRALTEALARIDQTLAQLRERLDSPDRAPTAHLVAGSAAAEKVQTLPARLQELQSTLMGALAVRDDVDRLGTAGMLRRLEELRTELNERLSHHDDDATAAIGNAVTAMREQAEHLDEVRTALSREVTDVVARLGELVESTTKGQREALNTIEAATARIETVQHETRDRLAEVMAATLSDLQTAGAQANEAQAQQLDKALDAVRRVAERAGTELPEKVDAAMRARIDDITKAASTELQTLSDSTAGVMAALQETTSSVGAGFNKRIDEAAHGISDAVREVREALVATAADDRELMREALHELQGSARQIVGELRSAVEQADAARAASTADLSNVSKSVRALQGEVEQLASRLSASVAEHEAGTRSTTTELSDRVASLLETIRTSTSSELGGVHRAVAGLREDLAAQVQASDAALESVVARLEQAATHHTRAADTVATEALDRTRNLEETAAALGRIAKSLEPALADTAGEVLAALRQTAKDDRAQMRDGIARIQQSAERMGESLQSTMVRHIEAIHSASTEELAGVTQSLAAARRALDQAAATLVERVGVQTAEAGAATGAQVADLQVAVDDLRSVTERSLADLRARVDAVSGDAGQQIAAPPAPEPASAPAPPPPSADVPPPAPPPPSADVPPPAPEPASAPAPPPPPVTADVPPPAPRLPLDDAADGAVDREALAATLSMVGGALDTADDDEDA